MEAARAAALASPELASLDALTSLHLGPRSILIAVSARLRPGLSAAEAGAVQAAMADRIRGADERIFQVLFRPPDPAAPNAG